MDKLKNYALLLCTLLFSLSFAACDDDEPEVKSNIPAALIGTWYYAENNYVTFNSDGTGSWTLPTDSTTTNSYPFTCTYVDSTKTLILVYEGVTNEFTLTSVSSSKLVLTNKNGRVQSYYKNVADIEPQYSIADLIGTSWGWANTPYLTFNADTIVTYLASDGNTYTARFAYDAETGAVYFPHNGKTLLYLVDIIGDAIYFKTENANKEMLLSSFFTILDEWSIADISTLVGKTWYIADSGTEVILTFNSDSTGKLIQTEKGDVEAEDFTYTYDATTKILILDTHDGDPIIATLYHLSDTRLVYYIPNNVYEGDSLWMEMIAL
ncbi:MAG: hypothetical protein Q4E59_00430 [Bacteroidales bacterium]|nr:hypothetical protein [Bacteroidales bacterium]